MDVCFLRKYLNSPDAFLYLTLLYCTYKLVLWKAKKALKIISNSAKKPQFSASIQPGTVQVASLTNNTAMKTVQKWERGEKDRRKSQISP